MSADMKPVMVKLSSEKAALRRALRQFSRRKTSKVPPQPSWILLLAIIALQLVSVTGSKEIDYSKEDKSPEAMVKKSPISEEAPQPPPPKKKSTPSPGDERTSQAYEFPKFPSKEARSDENSQLNILTRMCARAPAVCRQWCCSKDGTLPYERKTSYYAKLFGFNDESLKFFNSGLKEDEDLEPFTRVEVDYFRLVIIPIVIEQEDLYKNNFPRLSDHQCKTMMLHVCKKQQNKTDWLYDPQYMHESPFRKDLINLFTELKFVVLPKGSSIKDEMVNLPYTSRWVASDQRYFERAKEILSVDERLEFYGGLYKHYKAKRSRRQLHVVMNKDPKFRENLFTEEELQGLEPRINDLNGGLFERLPINDD